MGFRIVKCVNTRIERLKDAIALGHNCRAEHVRSVPVFEKFRERKPWEGIVEVFDLVGSHEAGRCYGWTFRERGIDQNVILLQQGAVTSPNSAVRVAIARGLQ